MPYVYGGVSCTLQCYFFQLFFLDDIFWDLHKCSPGNGHGLGENQGCCTDANPCPKHVGDCDEDSQCMGTLECNILSAGKQFGYSNDDVSVCGEPSTIYLENFLTNWQQGSLLQFLA